MAILINLAYVVAEADQKVLLIDAVNEVARERAMSFLKAENQERGADDRRLSVGAVSRES